MGGSDLPDDAITELDSCFETIHLHHLAGTPFNCSGMAHYVTSFDSHVLSLSDWVNNNNFSTPRFLHARLLRVPHSHDNLMLHQAPFQHDYTTGHALPIHLHPGDTALAAVRILHLDRIDCFSVPIA